MTTDPPLQTSTSCYSFPDLTGRVWNCRLNLGIVHRLDRSDFSTVTKRKLSVLASPQDVLVEALTNSAYLFAVIWAIVSKHPQGHPYPVARCPDPNRPLPPYAEGFHGMEQLMLEVSEDDFVEAIGGETIPLAQEAFIQALMDFFHQQRTSLGKVAAMMTEARRTLEEKKAEKMETEGRKRLESLLAELDQEPKNPGDGSSASSDQPESEAAGPNSTSEN